MVTGGNFTQVSVMQWLRTIENDPSYPMWIKELFRRFLDNALTVCDQLIDLICKQRHRVEDVFRAMLRVTSITEAN